MSILLCLIGAIVSVRYFFTEPPPLPEIPVLNVEGFDPEISAAIRRARNNVENSPRSIAAWRELALVFHAHGFEDQAVVCYEAVATLDPQNFLWPYFEGIVLYRGPKGPVAAIPYFERAMSLAPENSSPRLWLAEVFLDLGRLDEAGREFRSVLTISPDNERAYFGLGKLAFARQEYETALHFLKEVANHPSAQKDSCALRAMIYERLGDRAAAERERRQLGQMQPFNSSWPDETTQLLVDRRVGLVARLQRVRQCGIEGRTNDAISLLYETAELYPESEETWFSLGKVLFITSQFSESERALRRSIVLSPTQAENRFMLAIVEQAQLKHKEAAEDFQKAIELKSQDGRAHFGLGECLEALGDTQRAIDAYRQTLRYSPNHNQARQRLEKLSSDP